MFRSNNKIPYSTIRRTDVDKRDLYCPHPFTNWSLNPGYLNYNGTLDNTKEGFRKTTQQNSILNQTKSRNKVIYCLGGSTTYCTLLKSYEESWPCKLLIKLNDVRSELLEVVNAGVGGWGTLQSLIRFVTWGPLIKPELTIIYSSKNDLTFYYNGNPEEKIIFPDYSNIIQQFSNVKRKYGESLLGCYGDSKVDIKNLKRFKSEELNATLLRYRLILKLASEWNGKVLFMPEIINDSFYKPYMNQINEAAIIMLKNEENCKTLSINKLIDKKNSYFMDKMHFTAEGCSIFASLVARYIQSQNLLNDQ